MRALLLGLCLLLVGLPARAAEAPPALLESYQRLTQAWESLSRDRIMECYDREARMLDGRGKWLDRAGIEANVQEVLEGALTCRTQYDVVDFRQREGLWVARVHQTRNVGYGDKRVWRVVDREDVWRPGPGGCQLVETRYLSQSATVTGTGADARRSR